MLVRPDEERQNPRMCDAFTLARPVRRGHDWEGKVAESIDWNSDRVFRPGMTALVFLPGDEVVTMRWGFQRPFFPLMPLAEFSSLGNSPWKQAFIRGRCLVPASSFFEVEGLPSHCRAYEYAPSSEGWMWLAGIWDTEHPAQFRFALVVASPPADGMIVRRPVILSEEQGLSYLEGHLNDFPVDTTVLNSTLVAGAMISE